MRDPLISTEDLAGRLKEPDLKVVDGSWFMDGRDARAAWREAHIPGAVFFDIDAVSDGDRDGFGEAAGLLIGRERGDFVGGQDPVDHHRYDLLHGGRCAGRNVRVGVDNEIAHAGMLPTAEPGNVVGQASLVTQVACMNQPGLGVMPPLSALMFPALDT